MIQKSLYFRMWIFAWHDDNSSRDLSESNVIRIKNLINKNVFWIEPHHLDKIMTSSG